MKTWLITGAASGFGRAMTEQLLERGDRVIATVRRPGSLALGHRNLTVLHLDLTDAASIEAAVAAAFATGRIDVVVGNAGYGIFGAAEELDAAAIDRQIATNLTGAIAFIRAVLPHLRAQGGGRLLQVSSEGGQVAYPGFSAYHASKWGIEGFVEAVSQEVASFGIETLIVEPGPTPTEFIGAIDMAPTLTEYDATAVGMVRSSLRNLADGNSSESFARLADLGRSVGAIIAAADAAAMPRRLALGSTAYGNIRAALAARLEELDAYREAALAAD
ncbi:SDR family oxidoreductase [Mangrovicoccus sp. HB161399]|uniref:SDR family oxidoreductase n=1 Tax=Mangrovicoccus sp. HB161399 TaxID=2720392 RepID=UPI001557806B|nr:SDR family oxidoreductase [Mangrovicoccus sp. HB161399]